MYTRPVVERPGTTQSRLFGQKIEKKNRLRMLPVKRTTFENQKNKTNENKRDLIVGKRKDKQ